MAQCMHIRQATPTAAAKENNQMQFKSSNYSYVAINFRVVGAHGKLIHEAAASHGESAAGYCRRVMIEWAAADLGVDIPDMSAYSGDIISNAAKKLNMTAQEFTNMVVRESAAKVLMEGKDNSVIIGKLSNELQSQLRGGAPPVSGISGERERIAGGRRR